MRIVFMGTPELAAQVLDSLNDAHEVVAVYTRPDAVRGRGKKLVPSPVKIKARELGIEVESPQSLKTQEACQKLASYEPDCICVAAYGAILPPQVLTIPKYGCLNVHTSVLPQWRGAAPIERAILAGDEKTGVSIMAMEEGLDTGRFCKQAYTDVNHKSQAELTEELATMGASLLLEALRDIECGTVVWEAQDEVHASYAKKIEKGELDIRRDDGVFVADRKVRASSDAHPSHVCLEGHEAALLATSPLNPSDQQDLNLTLEVGDLAFLRKRLFMGMKDGVLEILRLKPAGKKAMDARAFAAGIQGIKQGGKHWDAIEPKEGR